MFTILSKLILIVILLLLLCYIGYKCYIIISFKKESESQHRPSDLISMPQITDTPPSPIKRNENPIKNPQIFTLKTFFESSKAEQIIYEYLQKELSTYYTIIPHVSLTDIFIYPHETDENKQYNIYKLLGYHVDFVIYDKLYHPVMAIELNGSNHKTNSRTIWTDQRKKELFEHFNIPLISLDLSRHYQDTELTELLKNKISESPRIIYCWTCHLPIKLPITSCSKCQRTNIPIPPLFK